MQRTVVVGFPEGLHARPAARFVAEAAKQPVPVTIARPGGAPVTARSILGVLTLGVTEGEQIVLETPDDGAESAAALDALEAFFANAPVA